MENLETSKMQITDLPLTHSEHSANASCCDSTYAGPGGPLVMHNGYGIASQSVSGTH